VIVGDATSATVGQPPMTSGASILAGVADRSGELRFRWHRCGLLGHGNELDKTISVLRAWQLYIVLCCGGHIGLTLCDRP
jgi:hypothetical protein